ncbi:MAG: hypothetical protein ABIP05_06120 [Nitrospiraceae bacterium]
MTLHMTQYAERKNIWWLSPLLLSILSVASLIAAVGPASLASAAECQVTQESGTIQDMPTGNVIPSTMFPLTIIVERDIYGRLVPSPLREIAPYMKSNRTILGDTEKQNVATIGTCMGQDIRDRVLFHQALISPIGKTLARAHKPAMNAFALPYTGKRQVLTIRTTPPEIRTSLHYKAGSILIGPVQEILKSVLADERSISQILAAQPSTVGFLSPFGGQLFDNSIPFQNAQQLPDNESLRMNLTTTQALHDGNCASGCP